MSTDKNVTEDLMEILEDSREGFTDAASKLTDTDSADLAVRFEEFSGQRAGFYSELQQMAAAYGDDVEESGSARAAVHRTWMALKDTISGSDPAGVLDAAEQGEDHAVAAYEKALTEDISPNLRTAVERQFTQVKATHDAVKALRNAHS